MAWTTCQNKKQKAAFVSFIRTDNFTADVVIVKSVKANGDENTHCSEQDTDWSLLVEVMTSEGLKDVSICAINQCFMLPIIKVKAHIKLGDAPQKNIIHTDSKKHEKERKGRISNENNVFLNIPTAKQFIL